MFGKRKDPPPPDPMAWLTAGTPLFEASTYAKETNFYLPLLAGASTIGEQAVRPEAIRAAAALLESLTPDAYASYLTSFYGEGLYRFGDSWRYADINTVLHTLATTLPVRSYLEIGVRRGRSLAMIASPAPDCEIFGFDMWVEDYAGMPNPGPEFVREELARIGFRGELTLISGDSHVTVPQFFRDHPDRYFDVITVDGDHTLEGARADLETVIPRLKIGGVLVFDDISNQYHPYLGKLWDEVTGDCNRWAAWKFDEIGFGVGFAFRKQ